MSRRPTPNAQRPTPLTLWGVASGFGIVRVVTSRVRAFYEHRYKKHTKEPLSRIVFLFDMFLVTVIALLIGVICFETLRSFSPPSFSITFNSAELVAVSKTPIEVSIIPSKAVKSHHNVFAFWSLPPGVEVIEASPKIQSDGSIYLGNLPSNQETRLHLLVRANRPVGDHVTISLRLQEGGLFNENNTYASVDRVIRSSALTAEIPPEFKADRVVAHGAILPIRISNQTDETIPLVELRPTETSGIDFPRQTFGDLLPHEERFVTIPLGDLTSAPTVSWSLLTSSYEIASSTWHAELEDWPNPPEIKHIPAMSGNGMATIVISDGEGSSIAVLSPASQPTIQSFEIKNASEKINLQVASTTSLQHWLVAPVRETKSGSRILGPGSTGLIIAPLSFKASIRYFSASGDQLGAGENPPQPNEETRYWIFFTVDSSQAAFRELHVQATLAKGVQFTGLVATPDGGVWLASHQSLDWKLLSVPSDQPSVMIGAEVSITPKTGSSAPYQILSKATAQANDINTESTIEATTEHLTTDDVDKN